MVISYYTVKQNKGFHLLKRLTIIDIDLGLQPHADLTLKPPYNL